MKVYLDNCCFNRPFDDQSQTRIKLEAEAKLEIQQQIADGRITLVWSYILDFENAANPFEERREAVGRWKTRAAVDLAETPDILASARTLLQHGIRPKDALHLACALAAGCDYFLTTDDALIGRRASVAGIEIVNPLDFIVRMQP
jgi:predicted nucleic acid-binding protein